MQLQEEQAACTITRHKVEELHDKLYREREEHLATFQRNAKLMEGLNALREVRAADAVAVTRLQERITKLEGYIERVREIDTLGCGIEDPLP